MTTVFEATLRAAELCKHVRRGAATGGSTTTLVDSGASDRPDDYYNGGTLWFITGYNAGKSAIITDFVSATGTFHHANPGAANDASNTYAALPATFTKEGLIAALNAALADYGHYPSAVEVPATGADSYNYPIGVDHTRIYRVEVIAAGETRAAPHFWWTAVGTQLVFDQNPPAAGDTIRIYSYANPPRLVLDNDDRIPSSVDLARLAWLTVYYACLPRMQEGENSDPTLKELFGIANSMRAEFLMRRNGRTPARTPHLAGW
jgi:hypothetical protein